MHIKGIIHHSCSCIGFGMLQLLLETAIKPLHSVHVIQYYVMLSLFIRIISVFPTPISLPLSVRYLPLPSLNSCLYSFFSLIFLPLALSPPLSPFSLSLLTLPLTMSPSGRSGFLKAGDRILKVNSKDVSRAKMSETLSLLHASGDTCTLEIEYDVTIHGRNQRIAMQMGGRGILGYKSYNFLLEENMNPSITACIRQFHVFLCSLCMCPISVVTTRKPPGKFYRNTNRYACLNIKESVTTMAQKVQRLMLLSVSGGETSSR